MNVVKSSIAGFAFAGLLAASAVTNETHATIITVDASGSGWCLPTNFCNNTNRHKLYNTAANEKYGYRDWFDFASPVVGTIIAATLHIWSDSRNQSVGLTDTFTLYAATKISFTGLAAGSVLGTSNIVENDNGVSHYVDIPLDADAIALLNKSEGGTLLLGGVTTMGGSEAFDYTNGKPVAQLTLDLPEPDLFEIFLFALSGLILARVIGGRIKTRR